MTVGTAPVADWLGMAESSAVRGDVTFISPRRLALIKARRGLWPYGITGLLVAGLVAWRAERQGRGELFPWLLLLGCAAVGAWVVWYRQRAQAKIRGRETPSFRWFASGFIDQAVLSELTGDTGSAVASSVPLLGGHLVGSVDFFADFETRTVLADITPYRKPTVRTKIEGIRVEASTAGAVSQIDASRGGAWLPVRHCRGRQPARSSLGLSGDSGR